MSVCDRCCVAGGGEASAPRASRASLLELGKDEQCASQRKTGHVCLPLYE
ncbi:predicted protein [Pyrenophora tritici-repentis Pt-1C-BFP]|uniref:Uncharacterized protein n=1 Tax=Pyrenophora tritici-repentis (strain Pt-1C-BFP) TaxID=426418 RepID=B2W1H0_PYRTR|nr:uncharacterized protein PTRG_04305 [Pyrenophora tritici-repentis Pt-1C-BFP]EDU47143.1 predicted protein [Pyrenophora tritici-repentis Pt-1C-BFP]